MKTYLYKLGFILTLAGGLFVSNANALTATQDGNWSDPATWGGTAPGATVTLENIIIPSGIDVNLDIDVTFNSLINNFTVDGTLTTDVDAELVIQAGTFAGSGVVDIKKLTFDGAFVTSTNTGDITVDILRNNGAAISFAGDVMVNDTLDLTAGIATLGTGSNLNIGTDAVIYRDGGSLATTGGVFNSSSNYHVRYVGGNKTTGIEINSTTLQNVTVDLDNAATLALGSDLAVHGNLELIVGTLAIDGNDLEVYNNLTITPGALLSGTATSVLRIETSATLNDALVFTVGSSLDELTINSTAAGNVELATPIVVAGILQLYNGNLSLEGGSTLTMGAGSVVQVQNGELMANGGTFIGTASYDVEYMGDSTTTSGEELTGTGLNDVEVNLASGNLILDDNTTVNGELDLMNGNVELNGNDLVLNGTLDISEANAFVGNPNSNLDLNITTTADDTIWFDDMDRSLERLTLNVTGGDIVLGSDLHIHDELILTSGSIILWNENLIIEQNADITGYSATRYIKSGLWNTGMLEMYVTANDPYLTFPVGSENTYSPASIQQASGSTSGMFRVRPFEGVYVGGDELSGFNSANTAPVVNRTWDVQSDVATVNMNLKLGWVATDEVNGFDRTNCYISHYTSNDWDSHTMGAAVSGPNGTYEIIRTGLSTLSPFAVAGEDSELAIEENSDLAISIYPNPATEILNIKNLTIDNQYSYQIIDVQGKSYTAIANGNNQLDVTNLIPGTYFLQMTNLETQKTVTREFIKK